MVILIDYDRILRVSKFCGKIITFSATENPYSKLFLGRTLYTIDAFEKVMSTEAKLTNPDVNRKRMHQLFCYVTLSPFL